MRAYTGQILLPTDAVEPIFTWSEVSYCDLVRAGNGVHFRCDVTVFLLRRKLLI